MLRRAGFRIFGGALLCAAGLSAGCAAPGVFISATPTPLTIVAGERATTTVTATVACDEDESLPCVDVTGVPIAYQVYDLPDGVTSTIDTSLQSPSTPTLVRITFDAAGVSAGPDTVHRVRIEATILGQRVGATGLVLVIVSPEPSSALPPAVAIAAGGWHSLAVLADGRLAAWGDNVYGQLGLGHTRSGSAPALVSGVSDAVAVSGGATHSLALTAHGSVLAWGDNAQGQLGLGTVGGHGAIESIPQEVPGLTAAVAVSAGQEHSLALTSDGTVWAWGSNNYRVLGTSTIGSRPTPAPVPGLPPIRAIAAGWLHSLAAADDGTVWIWGLEALGAGDVGSTPQPVQVAGLADIETVATSGASALALDRHGHVWGWGGNLRGQVGDGTTAPRLVPARIAGLEDVVAIAIDGFEGIALTRDGRIWRWGQGVAGALDPERLVPQPFAAPAEAATITAQSSHVLVRLRCGQVWSWGLNESGQLGVPSLNHRLDPGIVPAIGDGTGCATAAIRVRVASDVRPSETTIAAMPPLTWDGVEFGAAVPIGTAVEVTAAPIIADPRTGAVTSFTSWAGDCAGTATTVTILADRSLHCVARYDSAGATHHLLEVQRDHGVVTSTDGGILGPSRIDCGTTCQAVFPHGREVTLSATTPPGFMFTGWSGDCSGTAPMTTVVMDRPRSCRANHRALELRVTVIGSGRVTSDPAGIDCGEACVAAPRVASVSLTAEADEGWQFSGWGGSCAGTSPQATVAMTADRTCSAAFTRIPGLFGLTMTVEGDGAVTSAPSGIACPGNCTAFFPAGTAIDLTAQPGTGAFILGWFDDCAHVGEPTQTVVLDRDLVCRVRFTGLPPYPVADFTSTTVVGTALLGEIVTFNGLSSHVFDPVSGTEDPAGIRTLAWDLDGDGQFDDAFGGRGSAGVVQRAYQTVGDVTVRLRVVGGPFDAADVIERTITVLPNTGTLVSLSVTKAGSGQGSIVSMPQGLLECGAGCASAGPLQLLGFSVTLVATPDAGSTFMGWSGTGCTAATPSVTLPLSADVACTATFVSASGPFTLTVIVNGPAASFARVEALQPPGAIDCGVGGGTCIATLASGTAVILRPDTATLENNLFQGWTGCDTVGTLWTCTLSMNGPRTVIATLRP